MSAPLLAFDTGPPTADELRERAMTAVARGESDGADPVDAHVVWLRLVEGRCRLVEQFERGGRRYYVVLDNLDDARGVVSLDTRERRLAEILGVGQSEKVAAYELGLTPSVVSGVLRTTLEKLGLRSRIELVRLVRAMGGEGAG